ncbi:MAG: LuxR C-terminal-related transcriptional regulator [Bacteroidia bacterium]
MKPEIKLMHNVWEGLVTVGRQQTELPGLNFDEIISSVFSAGPFYFYVIDFFDMGISNISAGFKEAHGMEPDQVRNINDILALVHPDDMSYVAQAEKKVFDYIYQSIGVEKITRYKESYNFRFKTADGTYQLYNHQSIILTIDENGNFIKSLNIHTSISHITRKNNFKCSLIGMMGEPSYLNLEVFESQGEAASVSEHSFSKRELEIVKLMVKGMDTKNISDQLNISFDTVKTHRKNILRKSGCKNVAELVATSMSEGWV